MALIDDPRSFDCERAGIGVIRLRTRIGNDIAKIVSGWDCGLEASTHAGAVVKKILDWDYGQETSGHADTSRAVHEMIMLLGTDGRGGRFRFIASNGSSFIYEYRNRNQCIDIKFDHGAAYSMRGDTLFTYRNMLLDYLNRPQGGVKKKSLDILLASLDDGRRQKLEAVRDLLLLDPEDRIASGHMLSSFVLLPHDKKWGSINKSRAAALRDNPFAFFGLLEKVFIAQGDADNAGADNKLVELLCRYWPFFSEFGNGSRGFKNYVETFCLQPFAVPFSSPKHDPTRFMEVGREQYGDVRFFRDYLQALRYACEIRRDLLAKRLIDCKRLARLQSIL